MLTHGLGASQHFCVMAQSASSLQGGGHVGSRLIRPLKGTNGHCHSSRTGHSMHGPYYTHNNSKSNINDGCVGGGNDTTTTNTNNNNNSNHSNDGDGGGVGGDETTTTTNNNSNTNSNHTHNNNHNCNHNHN